MAAGIVGVMWRAFAIFSLVLAACGDHVGTASSGGPGDATRAPIPITTPIQWISAPASFVPIPTATPEPIPTGIRPCRGADLQARHEGAQGGAVGGLGTSCSPPAPMSVWSMDSSSSAFWIRLAERSSGAHRPHQARFAIGPWSARLRCSGCWATGASRGCPSGDRRAVTWRSDAGRRSPRPADGGGRAVTRPTSPRARRPCRSGPGPRQCPSGEVLRYTVTLTNVTTGSLALDPCPSYLEWLGGHPLPTAAPPSNFPSFKVWAPIVRYGGGVKESHLLNCSAVPSNRVRNLVRDASRCSRGRRRVGHVALAGDRRSRSAERLRSDHDRPPLGSELEDDLAVHDLTGPAEAELVVNAQRWRIVRRRR